MNNFEKHIRKLQKETPNSQELGDKVKAYIADRDKKNTSKNDFYCSAEICIHET